MYLLNIIITKGISMFNKRLYLLVHNYNFKFIIISDYKYKINVVWIICKFNVYNLFYVKALVRD